MQKSRLVVCCAGLLIVLLVAACAAAPPAAAPADEAPPPAETAVSEEGETVPEADAEGEASPAGELDAELAEMGLMLIDGANFNASTNIDNQWLPMQPGTQWIFTGTSIEDDVATPHRIEFTVTDLTKVIQDVPTVVAYIIDYADEEVVEAEIAFYAQDDDGNVWYFGEYPEEYEDGEMVAAPTWISGLDGALAGVKMWADPQAVADSYPQGWGPEVEWSDRGQIFASGEENCVPTDCYTDVLVIEEFSLEEPNAFQQKFYAPGVGNIRVGWRGEDAQQEELELQAFNQLEGDDLATIREAALALEASAYENSPDVYGMTAAAE